MGKGDKKSKKGKIWKGSYGNSRRRTAIRARVKRQESGKVTTSTTEAEAPKTRKTTRKKAEA